MKQKDNVFTLGKASKGWIFGTVISNLIITSATVLIFDRIGFIIDSLTSNSFTKELFKQTIMIMVCAIIMRIIFSWTANKSVFKIASKVKLAARDKIYSKI